MTARQTNFIIDWLITALIFNWTRYNTRIIMSNQ